MPRHLKLAVWGSAVKKWFELGWDGPFIRAVETNDGKSKDNAQKNEAEIFQGVGVVVAVKSIAAGLFVLNQ